MPVTATTFDALQIPLAGVQSINASAGTGKTFTITTLYLRYLLEAHCSVDQILVTTFTEAATAELKDRLRSRLSQTLALLREVEDEDEARELAADGRADSQIVELLQRVGVWAEERREWALERLEEAILSFDQAPVFTIHGFCGQVLKQLVFETGSRFNVELLTSQEPLLDEAVRDFVANSWTAEGSPLASWLPLDQGLWSVLHALAKQALEHPSYRVVPESADLAELFESPLMAEFETRASDFAAVWQSEREALRALIDAAQQKKWLSQSTHKPQQIDDGFGFIDSFARSPSPHAFEWGKDGKLPPVQRRLTQSELEKGTTGKDKHSRIPTHPVFTQYEELIEVASRLSEVIDQVRIRVLAQAAKFVREHVRRHKHEHGQMSFGDLLNHVDDALSGRFQLALQSSLRTRFRVAMVDEFQDTDPVQFRIFRRIFLDEPQSGAASPQSEISNLKSQRERSDDPFEIRAANVLLPSPPLGRGAGGEGRSLTSLSLQSPLTSTLSPAEKHRGEGENTSDFRAFVMIGDPKQSIYKFRGADIDAYLDAIQQVPKDQRHEMGTNWRSDESLVNAVQALFGSSPDPFLSKSITLPTVTAHYPDRMSSGPALSITLVPRGDDVAPDEPLKNELALQAVVARLAADIVRLINDPVQIDDKHSDRREVQPGDLAVLARTGRQLRDIQQALAQRGVPAVLSLDESVFETAEAEHLSAVLQAVLNPGAASSMMNALRTPLFGLLASEIATLPANESALSDWAEQFQHWNSLWQHESFIVMWRRMLAEQEAIPRLAGLMLGERQITNFLHLGELLHQHAVTAHAGPDELLRWFNQTRAEPTDRDEIAQLRLETDADAVQLCTVHKSKGLEYPIVFCPVLWSVRKPHAPAFETSRYGAEHKLLDVPEIDVGSDLLADRIAWAEIEAEAEERRLLYVALTRARHQCVLHWVANAGSSKSALGAIMLGDLDPKPTDSQIELRLRAWVESLNVPRVEVIGFDGARQLSDPGRSQWQRESTGTLASRPQLRPLISAKLQTSYSALTRFRAGHAIHDWADRDDTKRLPESVAASSTGFGERVPLADMPGGTRVGDVVHRVLEKLLIEPGLRPMNRDVVRSRATTELDREMRTAMLDLKWLVPLAETVVACLTDRIAATEPAACLLDIEVERVACELPFLMSLGRDDGNDDDDGAFDVVSLAACFEQAERPIVRRYAERVRELNATKLRGFLTGFIDLVFECNGRWYITDYKTTNLGPKHTDYSDELLDEGMFEHDYLLQSHLYCVAVASFLKQRLPDFDYDRDFGGVLYLFVRGIDTTPSIVARPMGGVFFDRPESSLIDALTAALAGVDPMPEASSR